MPIHKEVWASISHGKPASAVIIETLSTEVVLDAYICLAALALGILHVPAGYWSRWLALRILTGLAGIATSQRQTPPETQAEQPGTSMWRRATANGVASVITRHAARR